MNQHVVKAAMKHIESAIDQENERMDDLLNDEESLEMIRKRRLEELKERALEKRKNVLLGHGQINRVHDHDEFFRSVKESKRVLAFFYKEGSEWCNVMEKHLRVLCPAHDETKFMFIDAERSTVLAKHLQIWMLPTLVLIRKEKTEKSIVGLDELDYYGTGNFKTKDLEDLLIKYKVLKPQNTSS